VANRSNNHFFNHARWMEREDHELNRGTVSAIGGLIFIAVAAMAGVVLAYRLVEWIFN
jgi:hypothetical protein